MDSKEQLLLTIDKHVRKQGEDLAWMRGRLEEVHERSAQIPVVVADTESHRRMIRFLWASVTALAVLSAPELYAAVRSLL